MTDPKEVIGLDGFSEHLDSGNVYLSLDTEMGGVIVDDYNWSDEFEFIDDLDSEEKL